MQWNISDFPFSSFLQMEVLEKAFSIISMTDDTRDKLNL